MSDVKEFVMRGDGAMVRPKFHDDFAETRYVLHTDYAAEVAAREKAQEEADRRTREVELTFKVQADLRTRAEKAESERDALAARCAVLLNLEHAAWHVMDDSGDDGKELTIGYGPHLTRLLALLPFDHPDDSPDAKAKADAAIAHAPGADNREDDNAK